MEHPWGPQIRESLGNPDLGIPIWGPQTGTSGDLKPEHSQVPKSSLGIPKRNISRAFPGAETRAMRNSRSSCGIPAQIMMRNSNPRSSCGIPTRIQLWNSNRGSRCGIPGGIQLQNSSSDYDVEFHLVSSCGILTRIQLWITLPKAFPLGKGSPGTGNFLGQGARSRAKKNNPKNPKIPRLPPLPKHFS